MPKWLRIILITTSCILVLLLIAWAGIVVYVKLNKEKILNEITQQINENINGTVSIGSIEPEFARNFPTISVKLRGIVLRDSLWELHKHDLLRAEIVYASIDIKSILKRKAEIENIQIDDGQLYIYTDSNGRSNTKILKQRSQKTSPKQKLHINKIEMSEVNMVFENPSKFKLFHIEINKLTTRLHYDSTGFTAENNLDLLVHDFNFNIKSGSFLKEKKLQGKINLAYNKTDKALTIPQQQLQIDKDILLIEAQFNFTDSPVSFIVHINSDGIAYKNALALVSPNISKKLKLIDLAKPISLKAEIRGHVKFRDTPVVHVNWKVNNDNTLQTPAGDITHCNFEGNFINHVIPEGGHDDKNSAVQLKYFEGKWQNIPFKITEVYAYNLIDPYVSGKLTSHVSLQQLNNIIGTRSFAFNSGTADIDVAFKSYINEASTAPPYISGTVNIRGADIKYTPRELLFSNSSLSLLFANQNLYLKQATLHAGGTTINMQGVVRNFFNLYYSNPGKIVLDWQVSSPYIDVTKFISFIGPRKQTTSSTKSRYDRVEHISANIDKSLAKGNVHMVLKVDSMTYEKFRCHSVGAEASLTETSVVVNNAQFKSDNGNLKLSAQVTQGNLNQFVMHTGMDGVNIQHFFTAFNNFGQTALTDKNIRGLLDATVDLSGQMHSNGQIIPTSLNGTINLTLAQGALINFEPLKRMGRLIFRNRNLSEVTFNNLQSQFDVKGRLIGISPTHIESSAITADVAGTYSLDNNGTDLNIAVALRNPKKDELVEDDELRKERSMKGIVVHVKGMDGEDGNVKFKFAGLNKKNKSKKEQQN